MAKLESIDWPQDPEASASLAGALISALEVIVEYVPDDKISTATDQVERVLRESAGANRRSTAAAVGLEIARSALHQIMRR